MKIELYYKDKNIGVLSYSRGIYKYSSHLEEERAAIKKYFSLRFYDLGGRTDFTSEKIFPFFIDFLETAMKPDIKKHCSIFDTDTDFMKLFKFASVKQDENGYYIKQSFET